MKKSAHLTPGEFELMEILWPIGEATVKDVWQKVDPARKLAYTTVMTVLEKMYRKGILNQRKKGKAYIYSASLSRDEVFKGVLEHVCGTYFGGSGAALFAAVEKHYAPSRAVQEDSSLPKVPEAPEARSGPDNRDPGSNRA
jgi:predicted transcriptional regulator